MKTLPSDTARSARAVRGGGSDQGVASQAASEAGRPDLDLRMEGCVESKLYCLRPVRFGNVRGNSRCVIALSAVQRVATFEALQSCTVIVAAPRVRIVNCVGCTFYLWCASPPSIVGDCREIALAPFNVHYPALPAHLATVGMTPGAGAGGAAAGKSGDGGSPPPADLWRTPRVVPLAATEGAPKPYCLLPAREWSMTVVPALCTSTEEGAPFTPLVPVPAAYAANNDATHFGALAGLRDAISGGGLSEDAVAEVQTAVQAHLREWLLSCGEARDVADMVRLHRYAKVHAQALAAAAAPAGEGKDASGAHK